jgi:nicotinamidase-related amidase
MLPSVKADPYAWPFDGRWSVADTALIVIDMQTDFLKPGGYCATMGLDVDLTASSIAPARRALARMRELGFPIIHTREGHRPDLSDLNANKRWRSARIGAEIGTPGPCGLLLTRGEPGWDIVPEVAPAPGEIVIDKPGKGAFHATDLEAILQRRGIRNLVFAGVTSDCCVHTTMTNANDKGYECLLLADASAALETRNHAMIVAITAKRGGQFGAVAAADDLLAALAPAKAPAESSR